MQFDLQIDGLDELIAHTEKMEQMTPALIDEALIKGGDYLKEKMVAGVYLHGLVRRSGEAQRAIKRTQPKNGELFVGTKGGSKNPGFYLYMHEFGFYNVRAKRFIAPRPFASIIFESNRMAIMMQYAEVFRKGYGVE
ncbi:hypothetical protein ACTHQ4_02345 [Alkalicoccobacillus gibsonii]|uniref:hypothetical protein n=1 Tax=Alkalicoccobacillus gibsonii TaxID=79881 RepID=UPI003F7C2320